MKPFSMEIKWSIATRWIRKEKIRRIWKMPENG